MKTKYNRLFDLSVQHEFFQDGVNNDLVIQPDQRTSRLLSNGRLLFKTLGNRSIVLFKAAADGTAPFIDLGQDVSFRFYIKTNRTDEFFNITKLDTADKFVSGNKLYFTNDPSSPSIVKDSPEELTHELIDQAFDKLFTYTFSLTTNHTKVKFELSDSDGNPVSVGTDTNGNPLPTTLDLNRDDFKLFHQQVDVRNRLTGLYTIKIHNNAGTTLLKEESILIDNEAIDQGVLGVLDVVYNGTGHIYGATEFYQLKFERKETFWKYFIVNKSETVDLSDALTNLSIEDSLSGGGPPYVNVNFYRLGAEPHATTKVKGYDTVIFKSSAVIPSFEYPKLNINLLLQPSNKVLVEHLSNPPFNSVEKENGADVEKEIFVFI